MNSRADGYCAGDQLCSQGETYALSLWLPRHGQSQSTMDGLAVDPVTGAALPRGASDTDYSFHSFMSMSMAFEYDWGGDTPGGWGKFRGWLKKFTGVRDLYDGDFYPLLPYSLSHFDCARTPRPPLPFLLALHVISLLVACAGMGWQFHREDLGRGMIQLFRRANSSLPSTTVPLYGLQPSTNYTLTAWERGAMGVMSGSELRAGLEVALPAAPAVCSEVNATLKGWTPSACGSSTVIEYRAA